MQNTNIMVFFLLSNKKTTNLHAAPACENKTSTVA
jgi:hypothetical protein